MKVVLNAGTSGLPIAAANDVQQAVEAMLDGMGNAAINQTHQIMVKHHAVNFTITDKNEINYYVNVNSYL